MTRPLWIFISSSRLAYYHIAIQRSEVRVMANQEHLSYLGRGSTVWNNWRHENPKIIPSLGDVDLRFRDLRAYNLINVLLVGATLKNADLRDLDLKGANLKDADLSFTDLSGADLSGVNLERADLSNSRLHNVNLQEGNLRFAKIENASLVNVNLCQADVREIDFSNFDLKEVVFKDAEVQSVSFEGAKLESLDFSKALLFHVDFSNACGNKIDYSKVEFDTTNFQNTNFLDVNFTESNFFRSDLSNAKFRNADLNDIKAEDSDFSNIDLANSDMSFSNLFAISFKSARFQECDLKYCNFRESDFSSAVLEDVNLEEADFSDAQIISASFVNSNLRNANLRCADLRYSNLSNTDLRYADLRRSVLSQATLTGVLLRGSARFNWIIDGVECEYVFFDAEGNTRQPTNRAFQPGEFERLYRSIPTIEIVFEQGMNLFDPLLLSVVGQKLAEEHPSLGIELLSLDKRGLYPQAVYAISSNDDKEQALELVVSEYQEQITALKEDNSRLHELLRLSLETSNALAAPRPATKSITVQGSVINSNVLQGDGNSIHQELEKAGITRQQLEKFVADIQNEQELIKATQELQEDDIDTLQFAVERLQPHLEKAFNQQFGTKPQKLLKVLSKEVLRHLGADLLGDQTDLEV